MPSLRPSFEVISPERGRDEATHIAQFHCHAPASADDNKPVANDFVVKERHAFSLGR